MSNTSIAYYLAHDPVPEDRECVSSLSEILDGLVQYAYVAGIPSTVAGSSNTPLTNNQIAGLTQRVATLEGEVEGFQARLPNRRVAAKSVSVPQGDSAQVLTWSPAFDTTNYEVRVTIEGSAAHPGANNLYAWRVIAGTKKVDSCQISLDNMSAGSAISAVVEALE